MYYSLKLDQTEDNFANYLLRTHRDYLQRARRSEEQTTNEGLKRCAGERKNMLCVDYVMI